jgi:hypothetical protein
MKSSPTDKARSLLSASAQSRVRLYQFALRTLLPHAKRDKNTRRQNAAVTLAEGLLRAAA